MLVRQFGFGESELQFVAAHHARVSASLCPLGPKYYGLGFRFRVSGLSMYPLLHTGSYLGPFGG